MKKVHAIYFIPPIESNFVGHQMAEVYKDKVYEPFLAGRKDLTILDIGANIGITSYYFSQFADRVYSLEPSVEHFGVLQATVKENNLENIVPINKAIYNKTGKFPLFHNKNKTMYSLHQAVADSDETEMVEAITFEDLFDKQGIEKVDFMKLDVEGSEPEILSGSPFKAVADRIDMIIFEMHNWSGRNPSQVMDALRMRGFNVEKIPNDASLYLAKR